jgi:transposase
LRGWLAEHCPDGDGEFALEGCTGWRYVVEELTAAGVLAHLGDRAEIAALRGRKKRAKTDRADARLLRMLLLRVRFPESWIPPTHVLEMRTLGRLYFALSEERRAWQQRIHAQLFHQGCPPITGLLTQAGRDTLERAELSAVGRQYVDTALRCTDELSAEIDPLRTQLVRFAKREAGCRALQHQYGIGWLCAAIMWAGIGDARRFARSDQLVRFAGLDVTVYSSDGKCSPGHLSRQGSPELRWAAFEAAKCAARRSSPDYGYYHKLAAKHDGHNGKNRPWPWSARSSAAAITRCARSATPPWRCQTPRRKRWLLNHALRGCPAQTSADARGQLPYRPAATPVLGGHPGKNERPHPFSDPHVGHPINHHVAGPLSVDPDKAGRRHAQRVSRTISSHRRQQRT